MDNQVLRTVNTEDLELGMYVNKVCAQVGNLSVRNSGVIRSPKVIQHLKNKGVLSVEVDLARSELEETSAISNPEQASRADENATASDAALGKPAANAFPPVNFDSCQRLLGDAFLLQRRLKQQLVKDQSIDIKAVKHLSEHVCHAMTINGDAMLALTLLQNKDDYLFEQSINNTIFAIRFGTHMALEKQQIIELGMAALLMDIGMTHIPDSVIEQKKPLTAKQRVVIEQHVAMSLKLLDQFDELPYPNLKTLIAQHHERLDGSGYPMQISGDGITQTAQMLGIVDSYNAITSKRPYRDMLTANNALSHLLSESKQYASTLVQSFIRAIGIHPIGALVKLKSGKLAIVIRQYETALVEPTVIAFYSVTAKHPIAPQRIDLSLKTDAIEMSVSPGDHKLDMQQILREYVLPNMFE